MLVPRCINSTEVQDKVAGFPERRRISILGSTGSIGCSALELVRNNPELFEVVSLAAGSNTERLAEQILEFRPKQVALADQTKTDQLVKKLNEIGAEMPEIVSGEDGASKLVREDEVDIVLAAIVGLAGVTSFLAALDAGKTVALANKESLVSAGTLVRDALKRGGMIVPVDSEHSALYQLFAGEELRDIERLVLTASGGPFLDKPIAEFSKITPAEAVKHPRWSMGAKISIDSATLMNKGLELIEAHWLFGLEEERIGVLVHPQSVIHGLIEFKDGLQVAHLSEPDMKGPIAYALNFPRERVQGAVNTLDLAKYGQLTFRDVDPNKFPSVRIARECVRDGGVASAVFNIANEIGVELFCKGVIRFDQIVLGVEKAVEQYSSEIVKTMDDLLALDQRLRREIRDDLQKAA